MHIISDLEIVKLDSFGRGIGYSDKIVFVKGTLPGDIVDVSIKKTTSKYMEGYVIEYKRKGNMHVLSTCKYYDRCGGCHLRYMSYKDGIDFKREKITTLFLKNLHLKPEIQVISNENKDHTRNKIKLHIEGSACGFYEESTNTIENIDSCLNAEEAINSLLGDIHFLNVQKGEVTIKSNFNSELLIGINSTSEGKIDIENLRKKHKIVGIIKNGEIVYGTDNFIERIGNLFFKESFKSFFQVNRFMSEKLFEIISENITSNDVILDLCSGVGTLSIVSSLKAKKVYAIEILESAVRDALINAKMNKRNNVSFMLGDAFTQSKKISDDINTIIIDPPRSGITPMGRENILEKNPEKIIYISCNPMTLFRDLKDFTDRYDVKKAYILDMFANTYHCETICILERR